MHQPADIGGELLRLRARQQHAVVQRVQETRLRYPALLLDDDAVHHRDLAGRSAERQQRDAQPDPERLAHADAMGGDRSLHRNVGHRSGLRLGCRPVVGLAGRVAAPAVERIVQAASRPRAARDRPHTCATGRARRRAGPALRARDRAARCRRRERWSQAGRSGSLARPNSSIITSNVQRSPRWLQNTFSMSNGVASNRSATACTSDGATNRNTACGSTKRRISQGQAMRSIFGRARVTQTVRPSRSRFGSFACGTSGSFACSPGLEAAFEHFGRRAGLPQPGGRAFAELQAPLADDDRLTPAIARAHSAEAFVRAARRAGNKARIGGKVLVGADVDEHRRVRACRSGATVFRRRWLEMTT